MKKLSILFVCVLVCANFYSITLGQSNSIQLSLFNPVQIVPESESISGFRFNLIYGKNANVSGFDLGLVNKSTGIQDGVQFGGVNLTDGGVTGWQAGFVNISKGNSVGLQTGSVNYHQGHFKGLQFAIVNYAATLHGLQLGLINIIGEGGFLPVFPIFNFDFD